MLTLAFGSLGSSVVAQPATMAPRELINKFVQIYNQRNFDELDKILHVNFVRHCQATPDVKVRSLAEFKAFVKQDLTTFPDSRVDLHQLVVEGDRVAFFGTFSGTQKGPMGPYPASNKTVAVDMGGLFRIDENKIAELWITWDNLALFSQLGINPMSPPADGELPITKE